MAADVGATEAPVRLLGNCGLFAESRLARGCSVFCL